MSDTVLLVTGIFLDFSAALILLVPIYHFSSFTNSIRQIQYAIIRFGLLPRTFDEEVKRIHDELMYDLSQSHEKNEEYTKRMIKYEKDFFPFGIALLGIGFVFIVIGTIWNSLV